MRGVRPKMLSSGVVRPKLIDHLCKCNQLKGDEWNAL